MTMELATVLVLLAAVVVMFALDRPRMDVVALLAICVLPFTGIVSVPETLAGFSDPNIVLIAALFVVGDGLVRTGVTQQLGDWLVLRAGKSQTRLTALLMVVVCALGATMSSTAVTAIFIPVVMRICRRTEIAPGQLMMPLSFAALISGMTTLVATAPNLVVNSELARHGEQTFRFFSFTPFGLPILGLCIVYMLAVRKWLPNRESNPHAASTRRPTMAEWVQRYHLAKREHRVRVAYGSPLIGRKLDSLNLRDTSGANLIAIQRNGVLMQPTASSELRLGDILFVDQFDTGSDFDRVRQELHLEPLALTGGHFIDHAQTIGMAEVFVPADSDLLGKSIVDAGIRSRFGFSVIGIRRGSQAIEREVVNEDLRVGDTLLVIGPWKSLRKLQLPGSRDLVALNLPAEFEDVLPAGGKGLRAVAVLLLVVGLMISGLLPNVQAALIGCVLLGALRCIDLESAYRSIDWKTVVLIVGMLPFSVALERTGGVALASDALVAATSGLGPRGVLAAIFVMTAVLGLFISNTATAVLMAPVAIAVARQFDASPMPFAMIVALASSTAFMTPVSSPVNLLVVTPGGYRFGDFVRIGVPLSGLVMIVCVVMVPWLMPLDRDNARMPRSQNPWNDQPSPALSAVVTSLAGS